MRKIILNVAMTLDGYIEGPNGEYDWCFTDQDYGMTQFMESVDTIFFGRKSYELMLQYEKNPYPAHTKYVFSRTLKAVGAHTQLISHNLEEKVRAIRKEEGKDVWLFGGADLTTTFIHAGLVDQLQLSVHPLLLGKGKPLFIDVEERIHLKLMHTQTYATGLVQLWYQLDKKS